MKIPSVDLKIQYLSIKQEIDSAIQDVIDKTDFISGKAVSSFEHNFADYLGVKGVAGVASGTAALQLAMLALEIGPGDEVITTAHTFAATAEAIVHVGAVPIFVDIDPKTYLINPEEVEKAINSRTKAILPVHLYGLSAEMGKLRAIAQKNKLWLIEDAAQAHGTRYHGKTCGSMGDIACFSFYPGKNLGSFGDAGAVSSNNEELLFKVRQLRDHGRSAKYTHEIIGYGERLDTIQAAILDVKLRHLEKWNELRRQNAQIYTELLQDLPLVLPYVPNDLQHIYHQYVIRTNKRDSLFEYLKSFEIQVGIHYPIPLHKQPAFQDFIQHPLSLPEVESCANEIISLPMFPEMTEDQINFVTSKISDFYTK
jgi:dTDP-4-amino-4,6-dideoxygalactose transaminase